ncbi:TldD/PmbA family protein [Salinibius halmophilus]|uniref:TldD/PmbA family protein n=1 Tax=Salinibius halmophilus TaxID=1853216 RepID=UPI000E66EF62|nr:TldD/PmbA family protein [Salinibius halmophilus]
MLEQQTAQQVLDHALAAGADFADLFVERHLQSIVKTLSDKVDTIDSGETFGIGIRLVFGEQVLYGYSNDQSLSALLAVTNDLLAGKTSSKRQPTIEFQPVSHSNIHPSDLTLSKDLHIESKLDYLFAAHNAAKAASDKINQVIGMVLQREQHIQVFNSDGLVASDVRHYCRATTNAIAKDGSMQANGTFSDGGLIGWDLVQRLKAQQAGEEAARQALVNLSAKPCPSGEMAVVMGNGFGGVIFHEACGHLLETTAVAKKASVFHDQMGELIANPVVSAVDDGTMANAWGSINIDDEGMPTQRTQLIKDGKLVNFLADRLGAEKTGLPRTGSGRRQDYRFAPASRMRNTFIEAGTDSFDDMIASIDKGIYAANMGGGSVKPGTGEFNFAVTEGYYVENGKIQYPVKSATLIGSGPQVLQQISMVGSDMALACGMCGSISGSVPTSVGQPSLKVDRILVGGNA